ncbi:MAG: glycosyltransferase [Muribaculaceae bacterium]|nr:glycosyltransferase [Muribaculaceae bacterium]
MNICFCTLFIPSPQIGGVERVTYNLSNYFKSIGNNVFYITGQGEPHPGRLPDGPISAKQEFINRYIETYKIDILIDQYCQLFITHPAIRSDVKIIKCLHCNVDEHHAFRSLLETFSLANLRNSLTNILFLLNTPRRKYKQRQGVNYQIKGADKLVVLSPAYKQLLVNKSKDDIGSKVAAIPNSLEQSLLDIAIPEKKKTIVWCGRLVHSPKNVLFLVRLWKKLYKKYPEWNFILVGDGIDRKLVEKKIVKNRLERISITGITDPYPYYGEAGIMVLPSFHEGFPMVLLESMSHGCVPVVFDVCPAYHDVIKSGANGYIARDYDEREFIGAVEQLMNTDLRALQLKAKASAQQFQMSKVGAQWLALFDELMGNKV